MKFIQSFKLFEIIQCLENKEYIKEKIGWKEFLLVAGMAYVGFNANKYIKNYKDISSLYQEVSYGSRLPTKEESIKINKLKNKIIKNIKSQNRFGKFNKTLLIDSIENTTFKVSSMRASFLDTNSLACYIHLPSILKAAPKEHLIINVPKVKNIILINPESFGRNDFDEIIVHEIYHYVDNLLGRKSTTIDLDKFFDKKVMSDHEEINDYFIDLIDYMNDTILDENPSIGIGTIIDNKFVTLIKRIDSNSFLKNGIFYFTKLDNIEGINLGKIYYYLDFNIPVFDENEDVIGGTLNYEKIEKFAESEYHLSTDEKKSTNGTFKLVDIGDQNKLFRSAFNKIQFVILLEQK